MITGFQDETIDINKKEIELAEYIAKGLKGKHGKENAISGTSIMKVVKEKRNIKLNPARFRKIINYIRNNDLVPCLCSNSKGYYVGITNEEVHEYIKSLEERVRATQKTADTIKRQFLTRNKQSSMF